MQAYYAEFLYIQVHQKIMKPRGCVHVASGHAHCMHVYGVGIENAQNMLHFLHITKCSWSNDVLYRIGTENVQNM